MELVFILIFLYKKNDLPIFSLLIKFNFRIIIVIIIIIVVIMINNNVINIVIIVQSTGAKWW